eukprot:3332151-Alexandrium_andersonii.AAC.1
MSASLVGSEMCIRDSPFKCPGCGSRQVAPQKPEKGANGWPIWACSGCGKRRRMGRALCCCCGQTLIAC